MGSTSCENSTLFLWQLSLSVHGSRWNTRGDPQGQSGSQGSDVLATGNVSAVSRSELASPRDLQAQQEDTTSAHASGPDKGALGAMPCIQGAPWFQLQVLGHAAAGAPRAAPFFSSPLPSPRQAVRGASPCLSGPYPGLQTRSSAPRPSSAEPVQTTGRRMPS